MPPTLALLLCIGFIIFLLGIDRQLSPYATRALWVPTIWLISASSKTLAYWFGSPSSSIEAGSPLDRSFLIILMCIAIWILVKRKFNLAGALKENPWLVALIVFMLISISWSSVPFVSVKRFIRELPAVLMGFVVVTERNPRQGIECIVRRAIYILLPLSLILIKYFPEYGLIYHRWSGEQIWVGVADQKNGLGQLTSFSAFFLIWSLYRRWKLAAEKNVSLVTFADISILLIALHLIRGSSGGYSATSVVMLALSLFISAGLVWLNKMHININPKIIMVLFIFLIFYGASTPLIGRLPVGDITSSLGRDSTLTDRTAIWANLIPVAMTKPVLGHGVGGFWTSDKIDKFYFPAHNSYLEVILEFGFVGLFFVSMFLISLGRKAQYLLFQQFDWGVLSICWLTMALLNGITESSLNSLSSILMSVPLWLAVSWQSK